MLVGTRVYWPSECTCWWEQGSTGKESLRVSGNKGLLAKRVYMLVGTRVYWPRESTC